MEGNVTFEFYSPYSMILQHGAGGSVLSKVSDEGGRKPDFFRPSAGYLRILKNVVFFMRGGGEDFKSQDEGGGGDPPPLPRRWYPSPGSQLTLAGPTRGVSPPHPAAAQCDVYTHI